MQNEKELIELSLFTDDMAIYLEPKISTQKFLKTNKQL